MVNPNKDSVLRSIEEYNEIGLDSFAKKYGTGTKSFYDLVYEDKHYLARAIYVSAYNLVNPGKDWNFRETGSKRSFQKKHRDWLEQLDLKSKKKQQNHTLILLYN